MEFRRVDGLSAIASLREHWPEYLMEAGEVGCYLFAACVLTLLTALSIATASAGNKDQSDNHMLRTVHECATTTHPLACCEDHEWHLHCRAGSGQFLVGDPLSPLPPSLWNLPSVISSRMPVGKYLVGAFRTESAIGDRMNATIEVSREHQDFFTRNLVAILAEERLTLVVLRPEAFIVGTLMDYTGS